MHVIHNSFNDKINSHYNREDAVNYAISYSKWPGNNSYFNFSNIGGDCTNFSSQVLYSGGMLMSGVKNGPYKDSWYYYGANIPDRSSSWTNANIFRKYWSISQENELIRVYKINIYSVKTALEDFQRIVDDLLPGDIIQHVRISDELTYHSQIIHKKLKNDLLFCQHSATEGGFYNNGSVRKYLIQKNSLGLGMDKFITMVIKKGW